MSKFLKVKVECQTITPLISSGANLEELELRAASVKGLLRFWWRTFQDPSNTEELYKKESNIFGSSDKNYGASKIKINISYDKFELNQKIKRANTLFSMAFKSIGNYRSALTYLLFPFLERDKIKKDYILKRSILLPPFNFQINMLMPEEIVDEVLKSLWLLNVFGGIGARTRRGFGAFKITDIRVLDLITEKEKQIEVLELFKENVNTANEYILRGIKSIKEETILNKIHPQYTTFYASKKRIVTINIDEEPLSILAKIGELLKNLRKNLQNAEKNELYNLINGKKISEDCKFYKPTLGLPIIYNFKSYKDYSIEVTGINISKGEKGEEYHRRSSPLILTIFDYKDKKNLVIAHLPAEFLPSGSKLKLEVIKKEVVKNGTKEPKKIIVRSELAEYEQDTLANEIVDQFKLFFKNHHKN